MEAIADDNKLTPTSPVESIQVAGFDFMDDLSKKGVYSSRRAINSCSFGC